MKHVILAAIAALSLSTVAASAADLPAHNYTKAPMMGAAYNWTGFYAGLNAGYSLGRETTSITGFGFGGADSSDYDGFFGGGQVGYNWQTPGTPWVWGIESDIQGTSIGGRSHGTAVFGTPVSNKMDAFATVRGRLGWAWDRFMPYVTGGFAVGRNTLTIAAANITDTTTHTGWTVGGGVEWAMRENWTLKAEYLHVDLGSENYFSGAFPGTTLTSDLRLDIVRAGVNYRF